MMINNEVSTSISNIINDFKTLEKNKGWLLKSSGTFEEYCDALGDSDYLIKLYENGIFLAKGEYFVDILINEILPGIMHKMKKESSFRILPDKSIKAFEHYVDEIIKILKKDVDKDALEWDFSSNTLHKIIESNPEMSDEDLDNVDINIINSLSIDAEGWTKQVKDLYESINKKRQSFFSESYFWKDFYSKINRVYEFQFSNEFKLMKAILKKNNKVLISASLESAFICDKYLDLSRAFVNFYGNINFKNIYLSNSTNSFFKEFNYTFKCIMNKYNKVPKIIKRSILSHLREYGDRLMMFAGKSRLEDSIGDIYYSLELFIFGVMSTVDSIDCDESSAIESSMYQELEWLEVFKKSLKYFKFTKDFLTFRNCFLKFDLFIDNKCEEIFNLRKWFLKEKHRLDIIINEEYNILESDIKSKNFKVHPSDLLPKYEKFLSNIFNLLIKNKKCVMNNSNVPISMLFYKNHEAFEFSRIVNIMKVFSNFIRFSVFSTETLFGRLEISNFINLLLSNIVKEDRSLFLSNLFIEIDNLLKLFFVNGEGIVQLSSYYKRRKCFIRRLQDEVELWSITVIDSKGMNGNILSIKNNKFIVEFEENIFKKLDEYRSMKAIVRNLDSLGKKCILPGRVTKYMNILYEIKSRYYEFKSSINLLNNLFHFIDNDIDLFYNEVDEVFETIHNLWNIKWKYFIRNKDVELLIKRICSFEDNVYTFKLFMKKICRKEMESIFLNKSLPFSLESSDYMKFFDMYDKNIVLRSINKSMKYICLQYFDSIIINLKENNNNLFISKHKVHLYTSQEDSKVSEFEPPLNEYFRVFERIFPSQEEYFFVLLQNKVLIDQSIKDKVEEIIELILSKYNYCKNIFSMYNQPIEGSLYLKFKKSKEIFESANIILKNEIPFFLFEHSITLSSVESKYEEVCKEVNNYINLIINKTVNLLLEGEQLLQNNLVGHKNISKILEIVEYFDSSEYNEFLKINEEAVNTNNSSISNINTSDYNTNNNNMDNTNNTNMDNINNDTNNKNSIVNNAKIISQRVNRFIKQYKSVMNDFKDNINIKEIETETLRITKEVNDIENEITILLNVEEDIKFYSMLKIIELKYFKVNKELLNFNRILNALDLSIIHNRLEAQLCNLLEEWKTFDYYSHILKEYKDSTVSNVNIASFQSILDEILCIPSSSTKYFSMFLNRVRGYKDAAYYLKSLNEYYVSSKYFDTNVSVDKYLKYFNEEEIKNKLVLSKMDYEVSRYIENTNIKFKGLRFVVNEIIINIDEVEEELVSMSTSYDSICKYNIHMLHKDVLDSIGNRIVEYEMLIDLLKKLQKNIINLSNVFGNEILVYEETKYNLIKSQYIKTISEGSVSGTQILSNKKEYTSMNNELCKIIKDLKVFLNKCRDEAPRLYFVSDDDILRSMNDRGYYEEILKKVFNIDSIVMKEDEVKYIKSEFEIVELKNGVSINLDISKFINAFDSEIKLTLRSYFNCLINYNEDCTNVPSIVKELVLEYKYFNQIELLNDEVSLKIKAFDKLSELKKLYPKPSIINGELHMVTSCSTELYRYEYYPQSDIVFTPLTSKIFSSMTLILPLLSGIILYGRSGTGKTETVKFYCRTMGIPVFVFCCNDSCDLETLKSIIEGAVLTKSYICFDEFNRLNEKVMSSATELILKYKNSTKFFLTMNIGYKGRYDLPKSLKTILGEVKVDKPDIKEIINYYCGDEYGAKFYNLISNLKDKVDDHAHYDFGLRSIKSIININKYNDHDNNNDNNNYENITNSLIYYFMASLLDKDSMRFRTELLDIFNKTIDIELSYSNMLEYGLKTKSGVILLGDPNVGKTTLINDLSLNLKSKCYYFNPTNIKMLFGEFNKITGEWCDSIFLKVIRDNLNVKEDVWFIFDSVIESKWIETFNSILDDNKLLCLSSGERIRIPLNYKFIFECTSIEGATPATLTRIFLLYIDSINVNKISNRGNLVIESIIDRTNNKEYKEMLQNKVLIFKGKEGVGKKRTIEAIYQDFDTINVRINSTLEIKNILDTSKIKVIKGEEIYDFKKIIYLEEFNSASVSVIEMIREYNEYGKIGDLYIKNLLIICGMDQENDSLYMKRLENKAQVVEVKVPKDIKNIYLDKIKDGLRYTKYSIEVDKVSKLTFFIYESLNITVSNVLKFISTFIDLCKSEDNLIQNLFYFEFCMHFGESEFVKEEVESIFSSNVTKLSYSYLSSAIRRGYNIIVDGPKLSGKRYLVESEFFKVESEFSKMCKDVKIIDGYLVKESIEDKDYIILTDNYKSLPKDIINDCILIRLSNSTIYSVDLLSLYNNCTGNDRAYLHPTECKHENYLTLSNFYKFTDYSKTVKTIFKEHLESEKTRRKFLNDGIQRIEEFKSEAKKLVNETANKKKELQEFNKQLNSKLDEIIKEQSIIEKEKEAAKENQKRLNNALETNLSKKTIIDEKINSVKPLLEESLNSISEITKSNLSEIKVLVKPPEIIKNTIEAVFYIVENTNVKPNWKSLTQFIKSDDFISRVLNSGEFKISSRLEELIFQESFNYERAQKASKACGPLIKWVLAKYKYVKVLKDVSPLKEEVRVLEEEIEESKKIVDIENSKILKLEEEISKMKEEYKNFSIKLEASKNEIVLIESNIKLINTTIEKVSDEIEKWKFNEFKCPIKYILNNKEWLFKYKKCIFVEGKLSSEEDKFKSYIVTSLKDKNYKQVISNSMYYCNNIIVNDCDRFDYDLYRLIKHQMKNSTYSVVITSINDYNYYSEYTYNYKINEGYKIQESKLLIDLEEQLLSLLVYNNNNVKNYLETEKELKNICEQKDLIEVKNYLKTEKELKNICEQKDLIEVKNYLKTEKQLKNICKQKDLIESERFKIRQNTKKREIYNLLNISYKEQNDRFFKKYKMPLSFEIFKELVEKEILINLAKKLDYKGENDLELIFEHLVKRNINRKELIEPINEFYSKSYNNSYYDFTTEISKFTFDYTFITEMEDIGYLLEEKLELNKILSAGSEVTNKVIYSLLQENKEVPDFNLIKNIHLLNNCKKTGNNRFIYTMEEKETNTLVQNTRVIYWSAPKNYDSLRKSIVKIVGVENDFIDFHTKMVLENEGIFSIRDLIICLKNLDYCDEASLKDIIYYNRLN